MPRIKQQALKNLSIVRQALMNFPVHLSMLQGIKTFCYNSTLLMSMKQTFRRVFQCVSLGAVLTTSIPQFSCSHAVLAEPSGGRQWQAVDAKAFLRGLYERNEARISKKFLPRYTQAIAGGMADSASNRRTFMAALFFHELLRDEGVLGSRFVIKTTYDRKPDRMIFDLFSQGRVEARCDELEIAYKALLSMMGIHSRISLVLPNHVNTEIPVDGGYLRVDNAFVQFAFTDERAVDQPPKDGKYSIASTNTLARLGAVSLSPAEVRRVGADIERFLALP